MDITSKLQRRAQLEGQKADLTSANLAYEREINEAENQLKPIKRSLTELQSKKRDLEKRKEESAEESRSAQDVASQKGNKVRDLHIEVNR